MKNILVPVDFSETSISAFFYAVQLAEELGSKIILMHAISNPMPSEYGIISPTSSVQNELAEERLQYFATEIPKKLNFQMPEVKIETHIKNGPAIYSISSFAEDNDIDLIVMGTIEKRGIFGRMIGSTTSATINNTKCPVLLIHKNTRYAKPRSIVFGLDHKGDLKDALDVFNSINNKLKTYTEFIHVKGPKNAPISMVKTEVVHELVEEEEAEYSFEIKTIDGDSPSQDIVDYCVFAKADMLVLIHHEINFFARTFKSSISFRAAENIHLPVLIIPSN